MHISSHVFNVLIQNKIQNKQYNWLNIWCVANLCPVATQWHSSFCLGETKQWGVENTNGKKSSLIVDPPNAPHLAGRFDMMQPPE